MDTVRDRCAHGAVRYALVPSAAVSRVLRICDPAGAHVAADTVDAALAASTIIPIAHHARSTVPSLAAPCPLLKWTASHPNVDSAACTARVLLEG